MLAFFPAFLIPTFHLLRYGFVLPSEASLRDMALGIGPFIFLLVLFWFGEGILRGINRYRIAAIIICGIPISTILVALPLALLRGRMNTLDALIDSWFILFLFGPPAWLLVHPKAKRAYREGAEFPPGELDWLRPRILASYITGGPLLCGISAAYFILRFK